MFIAFNRLKKKRKLPLHWRELEKHSDTSQHLLPWTSSYSDLSWARQTHACLRTFALAVPSAWNVCPSTAPFHHSCLCPIPSSPKNLPSQNKAATTPAVSSTLALFYYFPILCPSLKWSLLVYLFIASKCMRTGTAIGMHNIICLIILKYLGNVFQRSLGVW